MKLSQIVISLFALAASSTSLAEHIYILDRAGYKENTDKILQVDPNSMEKTRTIPLLRLHSYSYWPTRLNKDYHGHLMGQYKAYPGGSIEIFGVDLNKLNRTDSSENVVSRIFPEMAAGSKEKFLSPTLFRAEYFNNKLVVRGDSGPGKYMSKNYFYDFPRMDAPVEHIKPIGEAPRELRYDSYSTEDREGNSYVINSPLSDHSNYVDFYVQKYDTNGQLVWSQPVEEFSYRDSTLAFHGGSAYLVVDVHASLDTAILRVDANGVHPVTMQGIENPKGVAIIGNESYVLDLDKKQFVYKLKKFDGIMPTNTAAVSEKAIKLQYPNGMIVAK